VAVNLGNRAIDVFTNGIRRIDNAGSIGVGRIERVDACHVSHERERSTIG
jgi:hypothetical protein